MVQEPGENPNPPSEFQAPDNQRWSQTFTDGSGLQQGQPTTLRWGIVTDGSTITPQLGGESTDTSNVIQFFDDLFGAMAFPTMVT
jgi:hypothetical protein